MMTQEIKVLLGIGVVTLVIISGGVLLFNKQPPANPPQKVLDEKLLVGENAHKITSDSAKVTIVEFGDYQCPACRAVQPVVKQILNDGKITFVFRNFPLSGHKNSQIASEAAEAAGNQGKFWEMHDKLYDTQDKWAENDSPLDIFAGYAQDLGLDTKKFKEEVTGNKFADKINSDRMAGVALGVDATPTFFVNGEKLVGALDYNSLKSKIDSQQ